jgi:diguanylate cyclase (GGDEF)-like protein/PAS domain S-box-containing protein
MDLSEHSLTKILDSLHDGLYFTDKNRRIIYWNAAAERITGYSAEEVVGTCCSLNVLNHINCKGTELCGGQCPLAQTIVDGLHREEDIYLHHKEGHRVPVSARVSPLLDDNDNIIGGIELFTDISNRDATELRLQEMQQLALIDHLTQLANRAYIERELNGRLEELKRIQISFAVMFIDIDHFKQVNDTYGHDIGDRVLQMVAKTLSTNARSFDLYGRWGGEEFIGLIRNITLNDLEALAERIRILIAGSFLSDFGQPLSVTVSIGGTLARKEDNLQSLLKRADALLYRSKHNGRNLTSIAQMVAEA